MLLDEPTNLPDGAEVALQVVDDVLADELGDERGALEASIERARAQSSRGEGIDGAAYIEKLRANRRPS